LLDQARVIRQLRSETGLSAIPDINVHVAGLLKSRLPEVIEAIREQVAVARPDEATQAAMVVLERARDESARERAATAARQTRREPDLESVASLEEALNGSALTVVEASFAPTLDAVAAAVGQIASMPGIDESWAERCAEYAYLRADVIRAVRWLNQLLDAMTPHGVVALAK
jgi:hypothetical protein